MSRTLLGWLSLALVLLAGSVVPLQAEDAPSAKRQLRAGAYAVDVTPIDLPVRVNGGFTERVESAIKDHLYSRAIVLDDGQERLAIVIVDSCMMPRELLDQAKEMASEAAGIPTDRILISATHTHTAPSVIAILGSRADEKYSQFLPGQIAKSIVLAAKNLEPAKIGWGVVEAGDYNATRRWIFRPDKIATDPFGEKSVRANMHPGYDSPNHTGPASPTDPDLSVLAIQSTSGRPIALMANYSMHYFGSAAISSDYFGLFAQKIAQRIAPQQGDGPAFVGVMSPGTSGDTWRANYEKSPREFTMESYTNDLVDLTYDVYQKLEYRDDLPLAMSEAKLPLKRRVPDEERLAWGRKLVAEIGDRLPKTQTEVYAHETIYLHEEPQRELILQALRIGDLAITAIPNEVYAITGLRLKAYSPLPQTINLQLANGADGYIPPPEQHVLGGYNTWPARSAGLEVDAEPKIVETVLRLLEEVAGKPRRTPPAPRGAYAKAVLDAQPIAYWHLDEMYGPKAEDQIGTYSGTYESETGVAFYLPGAQGAGLAVGDRGARAAHFCGGRLRTSLKDMPTDYSIEMWFHNGMLTDVRPVTGYLATLGELGDRLGLGGTQFGGGKLFVSAGDKLDAALVGKTEIPRWTWNHVVLTRKGNQVSVYLNGKLELQGELPVESVGQLFVAGDAEGSATWEGKLDEVAVFGRALTADEVAAHYQAATKE